MSSFTETLRRYKRDGCSILVTGAAGASATARATRKLLGSPAERRVRLLALTDPAFDDPSTLLPGGVDTDDEALRVLDYRDTARTAVLADRPGDGCADTDIERLPDVAADTAERATTADEGAFRAGLVSLDPLIDARGVDETANLAATVGTTVSDAQGMFHAHLRVPDDDALVAEFAPLFDARIELRRRRGHVPEQRWHLPEETSPWLEL
ncbi:DUF7504 family protein [Halarchaeum sp. P4]|uniref:DUF7504 family protein n=1 Tax=Halarchaeum sp. P4 TaxID=3421639 RepID=UPI003EBC9BA4